MKKQDHLKLFAATVLLALAGCSTVYDGDRSHVFEIQSNLKTSPSFHRTSADFDGYLISIEKVYRTSPRYYGLRSAASYKDATFNSNAVFNFGNVFTRSFVSSYGADRTLSLIDDNSKIQLVTQIEYWNSPNHNTHVVNTVWDLYSNNEAFTNTFNSNRDDSGQAESVRNKTDEINKKLLNKSAQALLRELSDDILIRLKEATKVGAPYTHIIVLSTGWNTPLSESQVNYSDWQRSILRGMTNFTAESQLGKPTNAFPFKPLYIGFAWPSLWYARVPLVSFRNKANDADEIGLTWANLLVNRVLPDVLKQFPTNRPQLVAIGHSFGARLLSRALNSGSAVNCETNGSKFSLFVGLETAMSVNRFTGGGNEGGPYVKTRGDRVSQYAFLGSSHDEAVKIAPVNIGSLDFIRKEGIYLGDPKVANDARVSHLDGVFSHSIEISTNGCFALPAKPVPILLLNASSVVKENVYQTSGGAHSDVYNSNVGNVLAKLIKNAPN